MVGNLWFLLRFHTFFPFGFAFFSLIGFSSEYFYDAHSILQLVLVIYLVLQGLLSLPTAYMFVVGRKLTSINYS